jgi:hypothetical protein
VCALQGTEGHNTAQIGGFVMLPPVIMAAAAAALQAGGNSADAQAAAVAAAREAALTHLGATHESRKLWGYADKYAALITKLALVSGWCVLLLVLSVIMSRRHLLLGGETCNCMACVRWLVKCAVAAGQDMLGCCTGLAVSGQLVHCRLAKGYNSWRC